MVEAVGARGGVTMRFCLPSKIMNPLNASQSTMCGLAWKRYFKANAAPQCGARSKRTGKPCRGAAMPNGRCEFHGGQEHGAAHARGSRAQQTGKLETRALFAGSQGGTVAPAGGNICAPRSVRLDLRPRSPPAGYAPHRTIYLTSIDANGARAVEGALS